MIEFRIPDLRSIIAKSSSCKIADTITLESRYGRVTFDLSGFEFAHATVTLKRLSGTGKIQINEQSLIVSSKSSFPTDVIVTDGTITIGRPKDGLGEIAVVGIVLHMDEFEKDSVNSKWKDILSRAEYKCLRLTGEKLHASQGAYITNEAFISKIETNPANAYTRIDGKIKFQVACEITDLSIDSNLPVVHKSHDLFVARVAPDVMTTPQEQVKTITSDRPGSSFARQKSRPEHMTNLILYDSTASREFNSSKFSSSKKTVKAIRSNNIDYLVLKKGGTYGIVGSFLRPNFEYVVVITAKKLNGNGRLQVEIPNGPPSNIIIDSDMLDYYVSVKSSGVVNGKITLSIPENGVGEVIIARVQIIEGIQLYSFRNMLRGDGTKVNQQSYEVAKTLSSLNVQFGATIDEATLDAVARTTKKYARQRICFGVDQTNISFNGTIMSSTFSGISWLNKIGPMFPTLTIQRSKSHGDLNAFVGDKNDIQVAPRIWLEPFDSIDESQLEKLRQAEVVMSPSLPNANYLDGQLGSVKVIHAKKPLPFVTPQEVEYFKNMDYVVAFNRHPSSTKRILDSWTEGMPRLALIGARGAYPNFVVPINEYVEYHKLLYILFKARCVIDLPNNCDYASAMLHMVMQAGVPTVTTNWFGMDKANCDFILANEKIDDFKVPSIVNLQKTVSEAIERKRKDCDLENYNENLNGFMSLLMSQK